MKTLMVEIKDCALYFEGVYIGECPNLANTREREPLDLCMLSRICEMGMKTLFESCPLEDQK